MAPRPRLALTSSALRRQANGSLCKRYQLRTWLSSGYLDHFGNSRRRGNVVAVLAHAVKMDFYRFPNEIFGFLKRRGGGYATR